MKDRTFIATRYKRNGGWLHSLREANAESREVVGYALEDKILEATPLKDVETAMLFTYMHRRFGLPDIGGDDYKDLSAGWLISTPVEDLALIVRPSFAGSGFCFMPVISLSDEGKAGLQDVVGPRLLAMAGAYERTLLDLLRPVIQRDMDFNVLGEISDDNPVPEWAEPVDDDDYDRLPRYHETCGLPMPDGVFGNRHWSQMLALLHRMGGGDYAEGMALFVAEAEKRALDSISEVRRELLPIIAAGFHLAHAADAKEKVLAIGVDNADPRIAEFCKASYGHGFEGKPSDWIMAITEEDIQEAAGHVAAFGLGTHDLKKAADRLARSQRQHVEWARFMAVSGGEFDETLIPDVQWITDAAVEQWRRNLAESGTPAVSDWAEQACSDRIGFQAVAAILSQLHYQKVAAERKAAAPEA